MRFFNLFLSVFVFLTLVESVQAATAFAPKTCCLCFYQPNQPSNFEGACKLWEASKALGLNSQNNSCDILGSLPMDDSIGYAPVKGVRALQRTALANIISQNACETTNAVVAHHAYPNLGIIEISDITAVSNQLNVSINLTDLGCESAQNFNSIPALINYLRQYQVPVGTSSTFTGSQSATGSREKDGSTFNETTALLGWSGAVKFYNYGMCNLGSPCVMGYDTTAMCTQKKQTGGFQFVQEKCCKNNDPNPPEQGWGGGHWILGNTCPAQAQAKASK